MLDQYHQLNEQLLTLADGTSEREDIIANTQSILILGSASNPTEAEIKEDCEAVQRKIRYLIEHPEFKGGNMELLLKLKHA